MNTLQEKGSPVTRFDVELPAADVTLQGELTIPDGARGLILFAHGSGSSRSSPRNRRVSAVLGRTGFATLLFDILTEDEDWADRDTGRFRFDVSLLSERLFLATDWAGRQEALIGLPIGYFGASTGAAAALVAAAAGAGKVRAVVSRGGRPDLAGGALSRVEAPTLLIVGGRDPDVLALNRQALQQLRCPKSLVIVRGATHLFGEPGALEEVSRLAAKWFVDYLPPRAPENKLSEPIDVSIRGE